MCGSTTVTADKKDQIAALSAKYRQVTASPFGKDDEIGMLNLVTPDSMRQILKAADGGRVHDLGVDLFTNMPSWTAGGDMGFQIWMSHTPGSTVVDDSTGLGAESNELVSYSGDSIAMYTHTGTHVDTLNHYGYHREIWNGFKESEHLGRAWRVAGADKHPPVIARGLLIDVAAAQGVDVLPDSFPIGEAELRDALARQKSEIRVGDVVMVRTGRMSVWPASEPFMLNEPGLTRGGAEFLARSGAITIGADNLAIEQMPSDPEEVWPPVHTYLLAEAGIPIIEVLNLEELAGLGLYEFAFIGACLKLRGATGSPVRPLALPLRQD
jgi:kynurenine formamidase